MKGFRSVTGNISSLGIGLVKNILRIACD